MRQAAARRARRHPRSSRRREHANVGRPAWPTKPAAALRCAQVAAAGSPAGTRIVLYAISDVPIATDFVQISRGCIEGAGVTSCLRQEKKSVEAFKAAR